MFEGINTWPKRQVKNLVANPDDKDKNCFHIQETVVVGKKKK